MELEIDDDKLNGPIWHSKYKATKVKSPKGLLIKVKHSTRNSLPGPSRNINFVEACFDNTSDRFIVGDRLGYIFLFDISKNRFDLVQNVDYTCTAVAFNLLDRNTFLVGLSDCSLKYFDIDKGELLAELKGHKSAVHSISIHTSGTYALTTSSETTYLWNLKTLNKIHKLNIKEDVGLLQTLFLPNSHTVLTCFCDDTIFAWDLDSMICKYQLPVPSGKSPQYRAFAASQDSRHLVAGGKSRFLHLWHIDTKTLIRVIEMPTKVKTIKQLGFLKYNYQHGIDQILGVLCQHGILQFIDIETCRLLFEIGSTDSKIMNVSFCPYGQHVVTIMKDGSFYIYSVEALRADLDKLPPPHMKVVTPSRFSDKPRTESIMKKTYQNSSTLKTKSSCLKNGDDDDLNPDLKGLNKEKLLIILKAFGEYPVKYRMFIWRKILQLPDNFSAYAALVDKGVHPTYSKLHEVYPIKSHRLLRVVQRIMSALAHWSPIFGETQFLPSFAFPFVRLFQSNHLVCFEVIATILVNWCQYWFDYFPNPPINILGMIENLLAHHDLHLLQHFVKTGVTSQIYAWPLLETAFSEVLTLDEWLMLWDNILSNPPAFFIMCVVAYNICARGPLMKCTEKDDFQFFFHHRNAFSIRQVINKTYSLMEASPKSIHPQNKMDGFVALIKGHYPVFNKYPKFVVDYQVQERDRIHQEEMEYLKEKNFSLDAQKETLQKQDEVQWCRQQHLLLEAENKRRRLIQEEESKLAEQRKRLQAMNRETSMKEHNILEASRVKFLQFYKDKSEMELRHLDDELQRISLLRDQETDSAIQETDIRNTDLKMQHLFDQEMERTVGTIPAQEIVDAGNSNQLMTATGKELLESFGRNRGAFDDKDLSVLHEVRQLRQRLAKDSRNKRP